MHAQPGTVGSPEFSPTMDLEVTLTFRFPGTAEENILPGRTPEDVLSDFTAAIPELLLDEFKRALIPEAVPEISARGRVL